MKKKIHYLIFIILLLFIFFSLSSSHGLAFVSNRPIKIGLLLPLTGKTAEFGVVAQKAIILAKEELKRKGIKIELITEDHQCDNKTAVAAAQKLITLNKVKVVISATCSGTVVAAAPIFTQHKVFLFATVVTAKNISGISPYVYRVFASDLTQVEALAQYITKEKIRKAAVIQEKTEYTQSLIDGLVRKARSTKFDIEAFNPKEADYRTALLKLQNKNPEAIFINTQSPITAGLILKQLKELNLLSGRRILLNDLLLNSSDFIKNNALDLEGAVGATFMIPDTPKLKVFKNKWQRRFGENLTKPNVAAVVYDTVNVVTQLGNGFYSPTKIRNKLKGLKYQGVSGLVSFDANNDLIASTTLLEIKNGRAVIKK